MVKSGVWLGAALVSAGAILEILLFGPINLGFFIPIFLGSYYFYLKELRNEKV